MAANETDGVAKQSQIFISHRHEDKDVVDVIRNNLQDWGHRTMFQSSDARHGPRIGAPLDAELRAALADSRLVLLVYTYGENDWSFCMWECGVAASAKAESLRIVVFQCTDDVPKLFEGQKRIAISPDDILRFTTQFHREPDFFPGGEPFDSTVDEALLNRRSKRLYEELRPVIPVRRLEEIYRWDSLTLELAPEVVSEIKEGDDVTDSRLVRQECKVCRAFGEATKHFGFDGPIADEPFENLVLRWNALVQDKKDQNIPSAWVDDLYGEILRSIHRTPSKPTWNFLKSMRPNTNWWFYPVVNHVRVKPDGKMQFDIYLYQVPGPVPAP